MFILRPSSPTREVKPRKDEAAPQPEIEIEAAPPGEPFVDVGPPVPDSYDLDVIRAMLQDPFRIFIYWEVREESLSALTRYFSPEEAAEFHVALKLTDTSGGQEAFFRVGRSGRYWMMVFPDREYEFEIGVRSPAHGFIPLVRSNRLRTPRGAVSPVSAEAAQYRMSPPEFIEVLNASGFGAEQSLDITVAAMPGASPEENQITEALLKLPPPVRDAILVAGAGGELTPDMIDALPDWLREELSRLNEQGNGQIASVALMHYLPEILREAIEDERELIGDHVHPVHVAPRFFLAGTENNPWPGGEIRLPGLPRRPGSAASGQGSVVKIR